MRSALSLALVAIALFSGSAAAFERDVHYGLTKWLALQAGFTVQQAEAIATGDQRVDTGDMQYEELMTIYACLDKNEQSSKDAGRHHFPAPTKVPNPPDRRVVIPGGDPSRPRALEAVKVAPNQSSFMLFKMGDALHALQDSWAHQGMTDVPQVFDGVAACDAGLAWAHPRARGGWNSHKADLTSAWPLDTVAAANATFEVLQLYPEIMGAKRTPKRWEEIRPMLDGFVKASTKTEKKKWFTDQGIEDVSFLEGISLPDGAESFGLVWEAHKLPRLSQLESRQRNTDADLLDFFNRFFLQWSTTDDFDAIANNFAVASATGGKAGQALAPMDKAELAARLRAWRIRDHGRVADIAHAPPPLSAQQRSSLATIAKGKGALVKYEAAIDAFYPLMEKTPDPVPLVAYLVHKVTPSASGNPRVVATTKFRHLPYDDIEVLAEKAGGQWRVVSIAAAVDH